MSADRKSRGKQAHRTGLAAEDAAARLLEARGMAVLARRYRCPHGEIDLIAEGSGVLVFVEVKARRTRDEASFALAPRQKARLEAAALHYAAETERGDAAMRFDVILVDGAGRCEHIENALRFDDW